MHSAANILQVATNRLMGNETLEAYCLHSKSVGIQLLMSVAAKSDKFVMPLPSSFKFNCGLSCSTAAIIDR